MSVYRERREVQRGGRGQGLERFLDRIERTAREVARGQDIPRGGADPIGVLDGEIALAVGQIDAARRLHAGLERSLLRSECAVYTELVQLEARSGPYAVIDRSTDKARLRARLMAIDQERRREASAHEDRMQALETRTLDLLHKRAQLRPV